jgi:hypothetical protein
MAGLPDFHSFREMCKHLSDGGAAYRFGSQYPLYYGKRHGLEWVQTRFDGGSAGECVKDGATWTADEQASTNWVLISGEDMEARDAATRKFYEDQLRRKSETPG